MMIHSMNERDETPAWFGEMTRGEHIAAARALFADVRWELPDGMAKRLSDVLVVADELDAEELLRRARPVVVDALVAVSLVLSQRVVEMATTPLGKLDMDDELVDARSYARVAERLRAIDECVRDAAAAMPDALPCEADDDDCATCGGSGGGRDTALRCPACAGKGVRS